jgi:Holliday junction resolvasome RuvABC endonuclease subunit
MKVIGIDPGLNQCAISVVKNNRYVCTYYHIHVNLPTKGKARKMKMRMSDLMNKKLEANFQFVFDTLIKEKPDIVGIEGITYQPRRGSGMFALVGGVTACKMAIVAYGLPYYDFMPLDIRRELGIEKSAGKVDVQNAVVEIYGDLDLSKVKEDEHEHFYDSVAIAHVAKLKAKEVK